MVRVVYLPFAWVGYFPSSIFIDIFILFFCPAAIHFICFPLNIFLFFQANDGSTQSGLFKLQVVNIADSSNFNKPGKKGRLGKYDWWKLHVVKADDEAVYATIDIGNPEFD